MLKKTLLIIVAGVSLISIGFVTFKIYSLTNNIPVIANPISQADKNTSNPQPKIPTEPTKVSKDKMFNILLFGIDRRSKQETAFRTDIMILLSVNQDKKKVLLTSVPRDLWVNGGRINAVYIGGGWEATQRAFEKVTSFKPDAFIMCDFEDLVWLVDAFGGVKVDLDRAFTDTEYPNDATKTYQTVSFPQGKQLVMGRDALVLSRSRHGNNGEGSDFKRMVRQHKILKAMPEAILSPKSIFNPFNLPKFFEAVTSRMVTDLNLSDAKILWDFYPQRNDYTIDSFYIDSEFLYNPPLSEYGGAWVLVPKNNDYTSIHTAIKERLGLIEPGPATQ